MKIADWFSKASRKAAGITGSWQASATAMALVIGWIAGGFVIGFTDTYQLVANTGTTLVTFVMVFLIQSAQNRDTKALHLKLNDLLCSIQKANEQLIDIENATDEQIDAARQEIGAHKNAPE